MRKALDFSTSLSITRYTDLVLFISCCSLETHTFILACGVVAAIIEDVDVEVMFCLPLFMDHDAMGILLTEEEERTLQLPNATLRVSNKSTYASWIRYYRDSQRRKRGEGGGLAILLDLLVYPTERPGGRDKSISLPRSYPPRKKEEAHFRTPVCGVTLCARTSCAPQAAKTWSSMLTRASCIFSFGRDSMALLLG